MAEERISNMRTVRAFGKELSEVNTYTQKTDLVLSLARKEAVLRAGFFGVVSLFVEVCVCVKQTKSTVRKSTIAERLLLFCPSISGHKTTEPDMSV